MSDDIKQLIAALEPAITEKALAVAETWISTGVMDDPLSDETSAGLAAHSIATEATLDALGLEDVPIELAIQITPLVEKRMAVLNAQHDRLAEKVIQRVRGGADLGSDSDEHEAAIKVLVAEHTLTSGELAVVEQMVSIKLTDMVAAS